MEKMSWLERSWRALALALIALAVGMPAARAARTWFVDAARGSDQGKGDAAATAWKTITHAVAQLPPGDTLVALPGNYPTPDDGLVLRGLPGARIVSQTPGTATLDGGWAPAEAGALTWTPEADGMFSAPCTFDATVVCGFTGDLYLHNYRELMGLRESRNRTEGYHKGGVYFPGPDYGLAFTADKVFLRLPDRAAPSGLRLTLVRKGVVARVQNSPGLIIDGFVLRGRTRGVQVEPDSRHVVVRNCVFQGITWGVVCDADHGLVEWCESFVPGLTGFNAELMKRKSYIYYFMKNRDLEGGLVFSSRHAPAPRFLEARYNYIHDMFDGDRLGGFDDSSIHHCVYGNCFDNAVELEPNADKPAVNLRFHHNWLEGMYKGSVSHQQNGVTIADAKQRGDRMEGPHYVDHNVIVLDGANHGLWQIGYAVKSRPYNPAVRIYYYNNLIWARARADLVWEQPDWREALTHMVWENNVVVFPEGFIAKGVPFTARANALVAPIATPALVGEAGIHATEMAALGLRDPAHGDFRPRPDSPLVKAFHPIATPIWAQDENHAMGPFGPEQGPLDEWPRPHRTYFNVENRSVPKSASSP